MAIIFITGELSAGDVIFPNKVFQKNDIDDKKETDLYKISHRSYGIGEQLNRKLVLMKFCNRSWFVYLWNDLGILTVLIQIIDMVNL